MSKLSIDNEGSPTTTTTAAPSITTTNPAAKMDKPPRHRPRYVWKTRTRRIQHGPPVSMKQYKLKPWKEVPEQPLGTDVVEKDEEKKEDDEEEEKKGDRKPVEGMNKLGLLRCFEYEHPVVTLNVGTLEANIRRALAEGSIPVPNGAISSPAAGTATNQSSFTPEVIVDHLNKAVEAAATVKRKLQRLVGGFIQLIFSEGEFKASDREILDHLCPRTETESDVKDSSGTKLKGKKKKKKEKSGYDHNAFIGTLARYLHSGNPPGKTNVCSDVKQFIKRAQDLGLLPKQDRLATRNVMEFPATTVTRSITSDLVVQFSRLYKDGSSTLHKKVFTGIYI